ncbi:MAG: serine/threonine protein phosphatase [Desulfobulbaceae bacterium]|uniref:Serine/threonine protein phosphatase n=1 Tax=Candidatus Desulfobia pelagia TaxID=2841692 RepID=A0A8J6THA8_9BACT|nr:serine/threonine protein phosphatase [Candidatus Desulfobia pelagia]
MSTKNRTYVIGDIHGCYDKLTDLLDKISPDSAHDTLVFLGDYIDRGPDSRKVVEKVLELQQTFPRVIPLMGNHEQMFLAALTGRENEFFLKMGGDATLASYGIKPPYNRRIASEIPLTHIHFLQNLLLLWEDERYIYVHAGLEPGVHLSQQSARWCCWARENFITTTYDYGKQVIFGHTPFDKPHIDPYKIGIDTGAVYGGELTCLVLPDMEFVTAK